MTSRAAARAPRPGRRGVAGTLKPGTGPCLRVHPWRSLPALALLILAPLSGCLEPADDDAGGTTPPATSAPGSGGAGTPTPSPGGVPPATPTPSPSPTPSPTPASPTGASPTPTPTSAGTAQQAPFRTLARGSASGYQEPGRLVFQDEAGWAAFWQEHGSTSLPPPERPAVDFARETVVAVLLGAKGNTCWAVEVTDATQGSGGARVEVTTYEPPRDAVCGMAITYPHHVVAIPKTAGGVTFTERTVTGPPPGA